MSVIVKGGGGSTAKELVNATGTKLADLEKAGSGKVKVVGGLGNTPPEKVLQGSIYSDESGVRRTGTMEDITPDLNTQSDLIKEIRAMLVGRVTEANAKPEDILKGKKAYVGEKLVTGVLEKGVDLLKATGLTKICEEKVTFSNVNSVTEIRHSLGVEPKLALFLPDMTKGLTADSYTRTISMMFIDLTYVIAPASKKKLCLYTTMANNSSPYIAAASVAAKMTNSSLGAENGLGFYFAQSIPYTLITMA